MRIVIVEDDAVVGDTLKLYLEQAGYEAICAHDGIKGLELARAAETSLVILDLMVPGLSGVEICKRLRQESTVPILMLTARASEDDRVAGLELGADDYVSKPFRPREVVARVQALLRRTATRPNSPPPPLTFGLLEINVWARSVRLNGEPVSLTPTEFRLLETLATSPGKVFTRDQLLSRAFGPDFDGLDRTVDVHITNLRRKIEPSGKPRYVLTVHGIGYRFGDSK